VGEGANTLLADEKDGRLEGALAGRGHVASITLCS
jgi:hypothetical protein